MLNHVLNIDPEIAAIIDKEAERQENSLELIASENIVSKAVMDAQGSVLTNKYAEGYPSKRYYGGCAFVDAAENLAIERAKALFKADYVNVQPHSGSQANMAAPKHVLRILRTRFRTLDHVLDEIKKYALVLHFLGPDLIARSDEFIVAYTGSGESEIVLCGLQEYVEGAILDPWGLLGQDPLNTFYRSRFPDEDLEKGWMSKVLYAIATFVRRTRKMIVDEGHIPDLAGNGNLILTKDGKIKLVDINNILRVNQDESILIDDKGYPACDKSVEVLAILDQQILKNEGVAKDPLYAHFLSADRTKKVKRLENQFFQNPRLVSAVRGSPETL